MAMATRIARIILVLVRMPLFVFFFQVILIRTRFFYHLVHSFQIFRWHHWPYTRSLFLIWAGGLPFVVFSHDFFNEQGQFTCHRATHSFLSECVPGNLSIRTRLITWTTDRQRRIYHGPMILWISTRLKIFLQD